MTIGWPSATSQHRTPARAFRQALAHARRLRLNACALLHPKTTVQIRKIFRVLSEAGRLECGFID